MADTPNAPEGTPKAPDQQTATRGSRLPISKTRTGSPTTLPESVEIFTDEEYQRGTGLFSILDETGKVTNKALVPKLGADELRRLYRGMLQIRIMDERFMTLQRQGAISFYGEARGQEAAVIGSAAALSPEDYVVPALREAGAALFRGLPLRDYVAQLFGNANDVTKGRQMPCHPSSRATHHISMSSCVATQIPHATGIAWAAKMKGDKIAVIGYMGEGATSEDDFHAGLNFAGVFGAPVIFVCQNNQWAISTPVRTQSASESFAIKAFAYGFPGVRVDGNDILAMYAVTKEAVERAKAGGGPTLIEAVTYRVGAHTSSDDPSRYRDESVTEVWKKKDPVARFRTWLTAEGILSDAQHAQLAEELETEIREAIAAEENAPPPPLESLFQDVYAEVPAHLRDQLEELKRVRARQSNKP